jgi:uncharacterized protein (TIGR03435 family)
MTKRRTGKLNDRRKLLLLAACVVLIARVASAQSIEFPPANRQWQATAGGKQEFTIASVHQNKSESDAKPKSNFPLTSGKTYYPNGGVLAATGQPLFVYILFAYKVKLNESWDLLNHLPKWVVTDKFDIQARTEDHNPTKDQMRLMMQSLLEDRFKLAIHWETREVPIFALVLAKPGKTGPQLKPHPANSPCSPEPAASSSHKASAMSASLETLLGVWPDDCDGDQISSPQRLRAGVRDMSMADIAPWLGAEADFDLPIVDRTGLTGDFDLILEFAPQHGPSSPTDSSAPTFQEALKDQLGLKLEKQKGPATFFLVDHVERPSEN